MSWVQCLGEGDLQNGRGGKGVGSGVLIFLGSLGESSQAARPLLASEGKWVAFPGLRWLPANNLVKLAAQSGARVPCTTAATGATDDARRRQRRAIVRGPRSFFTARTPKIRSLFVTEKGGNAASNRILPHPLRRTTHDS